MPLRATEPRNGRSGAYIMSARASGRAASIAAANPFTTLEGLTITASPRANGRASSVSASGSTTSSRAGVAPRCRQPTRSFRITGSDRPIAVPGTSSARTISVEQQ